MTRNKIFILLLSGAFVWGSLANPEGVVNSDSEDRTPQQIKDDAINNMNVTESKKAMTGPLNLIAGLSLGAGSIVMMAAATQNSNLGIAIGGATIAASAVMTGVLKFQRCHAAMRSLDRASNGITNL